MIYETSCVVGGAFLLPAIDNVERVGIAMRVQRNVSNHRKSVHPHGNGVIAAKIRRCNLCDPVRRLNLNRSDKRENQRGGDYQRAAR